MFRNHVSCDISSRMDAWCSCSWNVVQMWKPNTWGVTLKLLYAMVKRKKVSPIKFMMTQWAKIPRLNEDIRCTSLVTRIARNLGLLANASITYIDSPWWIIDYGYFNHAHMLKKGKDGKIVMMYMDYINDYIYGLLIMAILTLVCMW